MLNKVVKCAVALAFVLLLAGCTNCIGVTFTNNAQNAVTVQSVRTDASNTEYVSSFGVVYPGQTVHFDNDFPRAYLEFHLHIQEVHGNQIHELRANGDQVRSELVQNSWVVHWKPR